MIDKADVFDSIGKLYTQNALAKNPTSKFAKRGSIRVKKLIEEDFGDNPLDKRILTDRNDNYNADLSLTPIIIESDIFVESYALLTKITSKLYFLSQSQIEKAILMAIHTNASTGSI